MRLIHYSKEPIRFDRARKYARAGFRKPPGFWVSVEGEDDWKAWCEGEQWALESLACAHRVTLRPSANILHIDTLEALDAFHEAHGTIPDYMRGSHYARRDDIAWEPIVAAHDGIVISPYQWERRLEFMWYYGWDCASGVIWNLDAIEAVEALDAVCPT